ncbi:hypothetical protein LAZ67_17001286 [Cordylochernes scorpioides]|uniref:Uncharacterized protein n=1 Tax=Cordylochernes scorpioides TaxID=51811 RepID=A0ABY6LEM6_9ARAC|nr:hypothetical protein LAZ67_17001286 [Cordylochernes scorpioides]
MSAVQLGKKEVWSILKRRSYFLAEGLTPPCGYKSGGRATSVSRDMPSLTSTAALCLLLAAQALASYKFGYDVDDGYYNRHHHKEDSDGYGAKTGSYGYTDANGIYRHVSYVADAHGFRAYVTTNEPGTAPQNPADVKLYAKPVVVYPKPAYYKPELAYAKPEPAYPKPEPAYPKPEPAYPKSEPAYPKPEPAYPKPAYYKPEPAYPKPEPDYPKPAYYKPEPAYPKPEPAYYKSEPIYPKPEPAYPKPAYYKPEPAYYKH